MKIKNTRSIAISLLITLGVIINQSITLAEEELPYNSIHIQKLITHDQSVRIPGSYIIVLKSELTQRDNDSIVAHIGIPASNIKFWFKNVFNGFSASLTPEHLNHLVSNPDVAFIEEDTILHAYENQENNNTNEVQIAQAWGLDRIDQADLPLDQRYSSILTGAGVNVYVIDTGIRTTHSEFEGRAVSAFSTVSDGNGTQDCNGHGTHVAGIIGGKTYGVAKGVKLHAVRVLNCQGEGSLSDVIAGIDWVQGKSITPAIINMSLGGGISVALDNAVRSAVAKGITTVVAAGNSNEDACSSSPSRVSETISIAASARNDMRASYSNYGKCVHLFAPGSDIKSAWNNSNSATKTISGTSMAAPHATGVGALYLQHNPAAKPEEVKQALVGSAIAGRLDDVKDSPNLLLQNTVSEPFSAPCNHCTHYQSNLREGGAIFLPSNSFYKSNFGKQEIWFHGDPKAKFGITLLNWSQNRWKTVKVENKLNANEHFTYNGMKGYYLIQVTSREGTGNFHLWLSKP